MKSKQTATGKVALAALGVLLLLNPFSLTAKQKKKEAVPDGIRVIAHLTLDGEAQRKMLRTEHWRTQYLYLESADGKDLTIVDVTAPSSPAVVQHIATGTEEANVADVVGTAALVTDLDTSPAPVGARTVSVMSFTDPNHPKLVQQFKGVTAMLNGHGLIYLVNADGLWILQEQPGEDKELEDAYANYVLYNR